MTADHRLLELRRRVQEDPASIAFAQLAEECRRSGDNEEAVAICRAGLTHHPDYLSARVTLGRALLELGQLDDAVAELNHVLAAAPANLPANRALAEAYQKRGQLNEALEQYKRALDLAKFDPDIEHEVQRIENVVSPAPPPLAPPRDAKTIAVEDLFDFDTLLEQLGGRTQPKPDFPKPPQPVIATPSILEKVELRADDDDPFAQLEQQLRLSEQQLHEAVPVVPPEPEPVVEAAPEPVREVVPEPIVAGPTDEELYERQVLAELEGWLGAIVTHRDDHLSA